MSEFTAITTQEQFDSAIRERLARQEEKMAKKFEGYLSPDEVTAKTSDYEKQIADLTNALDGANKKNASWEKEIADRDTKIKGFELNALKHKVAHDKGLSYDAIGFLKGDDEDSINESADSLKALMGASHSVPTFSNEPSVGDTKNQSIKKLAQSLVPKN